MNGKNNKIVLGIIGGGQLGRMLSEAAKKLNIYTIVLDPTPKSPAGIVADSQIIGEYTNTDNVKEFARKVKILTYETESANLEALKIIENSGLNVQPSSATLEIVQDKFSQKQFLTALRVPIAAFGSVSSMYDIEKAAKYLGLKIAGVDVIRSSQGPMILEVNSSPGLEGIETTTKINVAGEIIKFIEKRHSREKHSLVET